MKQTLSVFGLIFLLCLATVPAQAADPGWNLRVFAAGFDPDLDVVVPAQNPDEVRVKAESDLGYGASLEYQFSHLLGVELGFFQASPAIELIAEDIPGYGDIVLTDTMSTTAITLDVNFHLTPSSPYFDVYLGAGLANMGYGNLRYLEPDGDTLDLDVGNDLGFSAKAGVGISLGKNSNWSAFGSLRYIWSDLDVTQEETATFDFNILNFNVGVGYRF